MRLGRAIPGLDAASADYHGDWFDDGWWEAISHNARMAAKIAKEGRLKGVMFDTEHRYGRVFDYRFQKHRGDKNFSDYAAMARARGVQFIKAVNSAYPDATLIMTMAASAAAFEKTYAPNVGLDKVEYGLLPAFLDGIIEAAGSKTVIVDGYRRAFHFTDYEEFASAYVSMKTDAAGLSAIPEKYRDTIQAGYGVNLTWHPVQELENALHYALTVSDRYVWVWHDHLSFARPMRKVSRERVFAVLNALRARSTEKPTQTSENFGILPLRRGILRFTLM